MNTAIIILTAAGALCVFLFGMQLMSEGIQKSAGNRLEKFFGNVAGNPFFAMLTGFVVTAVIQSSSATTVMVVSFANAGIIALKQAIGMIMGANIGTTATAWIVAAFGFKFSISILALPSVAVGFVFMQNKRERARDIGEILLGFGLLFLGLDMLQHAIPPVDHGFFQALAPYADNGMASYALFAFIGLVLTALIHSSSASTTIIITLLAKGIMPFELGAAMALGANIGTTIDVFLASLSAGSVNAKRAAWAHILFNTLGALVWLVFFNPILYVFDLFCDAIGLSDISMRLAAYHTVFNVSSTMIFLPLVNQYAALIEKIVPQSAEQKNNTAGYKLEYVEAALLETPELNLVIAKKEITKMTSVVESILIDYISVYDEENANFEKIMARMMKAEDLTDQMQDAITQYLIDCSETGAVSMENRENINALINIVKELESTADTICSMMFIMQRGLRSKLQFRKEAMGELQTYANLALRFFKFTQARLNQPLSDQDLMEALRLEQEIDDERVRMRENAQNFLEGGKSNARAEIIIIDQVRHIEHIGDYCMHIAKALRAFNG